MACKPSTPVSETLAAEALRLVHSRAVPEATCSLAKTKAKSTPDMSRPTAWAVPPLTPAKAWMPWAPKVSSSTVTLLPLPSLRVLVCLLSAKSPSS